MFSALSQHQLVVRLGLAVLGRVAHTQMSSVGKAGAADRSKGSEAEACFHPFVFGPLVTKPRLEGGAWAVYLFLRLVLTEYTGQAV